MSHSCSCCHAGSIAAHDVAADDDVKEIRVGLQLHPVEMAHVHLVSVRKGCGLRCARSTAGVSHQSSIVLKVCKHGGLEIGETDRANNLGCSEPGQPDTGSKLEETAVEGLDGGGKPSRGSSEQPASENPGCRPQHLAHIFLGEQALGRFRSGNHGDPAEAKGMGECRVEVW